MRKTQKKVVSSQHSVGAERLETIGFLNHLWICAPFMLRQAQHEREYSHCSGPFTLSLSKGGFASSVSISNRKAIEAWMRRTSLSPLAMLATAYFFTDFVQRFFPPEVTDAFMYFRVTGERSS